MNAIEPFLVKAALLAGGVGGTVAVDQYGMLAGVALTIGFFPAFIGHALLTALIPSISEAYSRRENGKVIMRLRQAVFITLGYGVPSVLVMYQFAEPLTHLFFDSPEASVYLKLLWPFFLFNFFVMPFQASLIGMGLVKDAFYHNVWASTISFVMMYVLGSMSEFQMTGIILGMNMGVILLTSMHYLTICKELNMTIFMMGRTNPAVNKF
jgi:O-antigen/teichoic acid export membrane protein